MKISKFINNKLLQHETKVEVTVLTSAWFYDQLKEIVRQGGFLKVSDALLFYAVEGYYFKEQNGEQIHDKEKI